MAWIYALLMNITNFKLLLSKKISAKGWLAIILITFAGLILRIWLVPHVHHVYFDEFCHMNIAENLMHFGKAFVTLDGGEHFYKAYKLELWPAGFHTLLAGSFFLFGNSEAVAFNMSVFTGTLSIFVFFIIIFILFANENIAICSAFLFSLLPIHLKYSGSASPDITSLCFVLIGLLACLNYIRLPDKKSLSFAVFSIGLTAYMRPENGMFALLLITLIFFGKTFYSPEKKQSQGLKTAGSPLERGIAFLLLFIILMPYLTHIAIGIFVLPSPGWNQTLFEHLTLLKGNIVDNIVYFFYDTFPVSFTILSIFGGVHLFKKHRSICVYFIIWFILLIIFFALYHVGNFIFCPDSDRYALTVSIPVSIFAGFGFYKLLIVFRTKKIAVLFLFLSIIISAYTFFYFSLSRTLDRDVFQEYYFILSNKDRIPDNLACISYTPAVIISTIHKNAIAPFLFMEQKEKPREVILFKDEWWYVSNFDQRNIIKQLRQEYDFNVLSRLKTPHDRIYAFIKLIKKSGSSKV